MKRDFLIMTLPFVLASQVLAQSEAGVLKALHLACPGMSVHAQSLQIEKSVLKPASLTDKDLRGWKSVYQVKVSVANQPSSVLAADFKAAGQQCFFDIESSQQQWLSISKAPCQAICKDKKYPTGRVAYFGVNGSEKLE